jgi:RND family efflux transporter MFP subunit
MKRLKGMPVGAWMLLMGGMAVIGLAGCGEPEPAAQPRPVSVKLMTVGHTSDRVRRYPGRVVATERAELAFRVSGQLVALPVRDGQKVEQGELLAELDARDFRNDLDQRLADAKLAGNQYRRGQTLSKRGMIADSELDELTARHQQAQAALSQARDNLSYTRLTAPYDGVVASTEQENHQFVQAREPVLYLQSADTIDVHFSVSEGFIRRVLPLGPSFRPEVVFPGLPEQRFRAVYREHESRPGATQAYTIVVTLPVPDDLVLLPGMSVTVRVDRAAERQGDKTAPIVPVEAVFNGDEATGARVWRLDTENDTVEAQPVTLGAVSGDGVASLEGLSAGDRIVVAGVHRLEEGQAVRELTRERGL